jgi:hypothetical protein
VCSPLYAGSELFFFCKHTQIAYVSFFFQHDRSAFYDRCGNYLMEVGEKPIHNVLVFDLTHSFYIQTLKCRHISKSLPFPRDFF